MSTVSDNLIRIRKALGFTRQYVSDCTGIPYPSLSNYETGTRSIQDQTLKKLADLYGVKIEEIKGNGNPTIGPTETKKETAQTEKVERFTVEGVRGFLESMGYIKPGEDLSRTDLAFLTSILCALDSWFGK